MEHLSIEQSIVFLPCRSLNENHKFFAGVMGLELALDQVGCRIYRVAGSAYLGFCASEDPIPTPYRTILTMVTSDLEGWHDRLAEQGIEMDGGPRHNPTFQITHFFAKSPDGYRVEFQKFEDPRWGEHLAKINSD